MTGLAAATGLTDSLFGGDDGPLGSAPEVRNVTPRRINLPGLSLRRSGSTFNIERGGEVTPLLQNIREVRGEQADVLRGAAEDLSPAIGRLTDTRRRIMQAERRRTMSDLREQLGRRRISGSSFAADTLARAGAEFGVREAEAQAEGELKQIFAETDMLNRAAEAEIAGIQPALEQLGFETQLGAQLVSNLTNSNQSVQTANAQLAQAHAQGQGELIGSVIGSAAGLLAFG